MTELPPSSTVTIGDLFRVLTTMNENVTKVATKLEVIDSRNKMADDLHRDHESRIRLLEQMKWKLMGAAAAVSAIISSLAIYFTHHP